MGFVDSKFKFNLYHKHFPEALEKYPVLLSLLSFSILVMYVLMYAFMYVLRLYAAKFAAAFHGALVFSSTLITFFINCQNSLLVYGL